MQEQGKNVSRAPRINQNSLHFTTNYQQGNDEGIIMILKQAAFMNCMKYQISFSYMLQWDKSDIKFDITDMLYVYRLRTWYSSVDDIEHPTLCIKRTQGDQ